MNTFFALVTSAFLVPLLCAGLVWADENELNSRALEQFIRGTTAAQQGNSFEACFFLEEALRLDASSPFLYVALAEQYIQLAQRTETTESFDRAESRLKQALEIDPKYAPALELMSRLLSARGKVEEAQRMVEHLVNSYPDERKYKIDLLTLSLTNRRFDRVDEIYRELSPDSAQDFDLARQVVAIYLMSGETERALPYMESLAKDDSLNAPVAYTLGTLYLQNGDTARALYEVDRALSLDSTDSRTWYLKLVIEFNEGDYAQVLRLASVARAAAPEDARSANLEGLTQLRLGDTTAAIERFMRAVDIDSTLYPAAGSLALLYDVKDSIDLSVNYYEQAIRFSDSAAIYLNNLAYTLAVRGIELERALFLVERALETEPQNASYLDTKGWIYYRMGRFEDAETWIRKALKLDQSSAPILEHLGDVYFALGKKSQARKYWQQALKSDPNLTTVKEKLAP